MRFTGKDVVSCQKMPCILAVDVGIHNLAFVSVITTSEHNIVAISSSHVVDITRVRCLPDCTLHHSNNIVDRMNHVFAYYEKYFEEADEVLVERQPLVGFVHVEALILSRYRHKASLVQPVAVQKHFKWPRCNYELKKQAAVDTAAPYMPCLADITRKHDLADAFCLILYTCQKKSKALQNEQWKATRRNKGTDNHRNPFARFAFACQTLAIPSDTSSGRQQPCTCSPVATEASNADTAESNTRLASLK